MFVAGPQAGVEKERGKIVPPIDVIKPLLGGSGTTATLWRVGPIHREPTGSVRPIMKYSKKHNSGEMRIEH